ncbi:hypothetical protein GGR56DRAFT_195979 [Xylariaceae sp. FL0804]|nr:hypothetical protein GGR56DRAFT_195979 [Xylariaceae sp. FL0804]
MTSVRTYSEGHSALSRSMVFVRVDSRKLSTGGASSPRLGDPGGGGYEILRRHLGGHLPVDGNLDDTRRLTSGQAHAYMSLNQRSRGRVGIGRQKALCCATRRDEAPPPSGAETLAQRRRSAAGGALGGRVGLNAHAPTTGSLIGAGTHDLRPSLGSLTVFCTWLGRCGRMLDLRSVKRCGWMGRFGELRGEGQRRWWEGVLAKTKLANQGF